MIPYGRQSIDQADLDAVRAVLESDFLTQGPAVPSFEHALSALCQGAHAVAVNSATSALHIAYLGLGVSPGKRVWTSPITFVATANAALMCGATVDFVDVDFATGNLSVEALTQKLSQAEVNGTLPDVVVPVHFAGVPCDMARIHQLALRYGFKIVEDASHAIGSSDTRGPTGACCFSDATVFSFHPVKIITTGEGGAVLSRDRGLTERMASLRSHGITRDANLMRGEPDGAWYYQQLELGYNYRMTDIQAALGLSQIKKIDTFLTQRRFLVERYHRLLKQLPVQCPAIEGLNQSAWHLYTVQLHDASIRGKTFEALRLAGIGVNVHYIPVYLQPYYQDLGFRPGHCPVAERFYQASITLPLFPAMTESMQDRVVAALKASLDTVPA
ncbi:UDP-4-amino-4,6-dideoxy-N-acetyl-beta-L-altrosamine transaminase [Burkholderiaceae bacterium DAT-1]|nr:UDP-4-amino-4,6-dideoxy-N-acetyl-beta-L-altrosamine transaminase [Burkholderiaceae bacterium DAT-1]